MFFWSMFRAPRRRGLRTSRRAIGRAFQTERSRVVEEEEKIKQRKEERSERIYKVAGVIH